MSVSTRYYPGGLIAAAPAKNRAEEWDGGASTYTAWDVNGTQTTTRALTAAEITALAAVDTQSVADGNRATLQQRAQAALTANTTFLGIASPTNAQVVAQVQTLTKECSALVRLLLGQLDSVSGT